MNPIVADIESIRAFVPTDPRVVALKGRFTRVLSAAQANDKEWMNVHALVYREVGSAVMVAVAGEGMQLLLNDMIQTGPSCVMAIHFVLGGEVGINANSKVRIVSERSVEAVNPSFLANVRRVTVGVWANVSHEKSQKLLIQTNGGVMGIKG